MSLTVAALSNIPSVVVSVFPYLIILAAFGGFVLWNNGVVLGEFQHCQLPLVGCTAYNVFASRA